MKERPANLAYLTLSNWRVTSLFFLPTLSPCLHVPTPRLLARPARLDRFVGCRCASRTLDDLCLACFVGGSFSPVLSYPGALHRAAKLRSGPSAWDAVAREGKDKRSALDLLHPVQDVGRRASGHA